MSAVVCLCGCGEEMHPVIEGTNGARGQCHHRHPECADGFLPQAPPSAWRGEPQPVKVFSADELEELTMMGRTRDGKYVLGEGAAERLLTNIRRLIRAGEHLQRGPR